MLRVKSTRLVRVAVVSSYEQDFATTLSEVTVSVSRSFLIVQTCRGTAIP